MKWQELSGEERYRVVELARKGEVPMRELCRTFGVSRQTLYRAMEAADQASMAALEPKRRGRKPRPESEVQREEWEQEKADLQKELARCTPQPDLSITILANPGRKNGRPNQRTPGNPPGLSGLADPQRGTPQQRRPV